MTARALMPDEDGENLTTGSDNPDDDDYEGDEDNGDDLDPEAYDKVQDVMKYLKVKNKQDYAPIPGSIYRAWAFGLGFGAQPYHQTAAVLLVITQAIAPFAIAFYAVYSLDFTHVKWFDVSDWYYSEEAGVSAITTRLLAVLLLFCFLANEALGMGGIRPDWAKLQMIRNEALTPKLRSQTSSVALHLGAVINSITSIMICIDTTLFMAMAIADGSPSDVVMNILAFKFLLTMDDLAGDMGFLGDLPWDADGMGELYYTYTSSKDPDDVSVRNMSKYGNPLLAVLEVLLYIFALALPLTLALASNIQSSDKQVEFQDVDSLKSQVDALLAANNVSAIQSQVGALLAANTQLAAQMHSLTVQLAQLAASSNVTLR